jgi:hypothetical protein
MDDKSVGFKSLTVNWSLSDNDDVFGLDRIGSLEPLDNLRLLIVGTN